MISSLTSFLPLSFKFCPSSFEPCHSCVSLCSLCFVTSLVEPYHRLSDDKVLWNNRKRGRDDNKTGAWVANKPIKRVCADRVLKFSRNYDRRYSWMMSHCHFACFAFPTFPRGPCLDSHSATPHILVVLHLLILDAPCEPGTIHEILVVKAYCLVHA
ncbi:hypothetical protein RvY_11326 [Ramazzottius varieornatus]|uniref:Uncharacterized protein n=1 Tax=Ramazzottius varieornatus TaxID=947166 RepID=A0A1D1VFQ2_RAMVA|nr:hypothetical protein RvY_11326 [Ramazzottius varieornatus]